MLFPCSKVNRLWAQNTNSSLRLTDIDKMPSLSAKDVSHISKFNGVNFAFWKLNIRTVLQRHRLYGIANGEILRPEVNYLNDNARAIRKWDDKDSIVRLALLSTLEPQIAMTLQHCETGADMWNRLVIQYEQAAIESKSILFNKFGHYEYVVGHTVMQHISALEGLFVQLQALNCLVDPGQLVGQILMTLPEEFDGFLLTWNGLAEADKTIATLTSKLLLHESMLAAQTDKRKKNDQKENALLSQQNVECKNCGLTNHKTEDCRKRKGGSGKRHTGKRVKLTCTYCGFNGHEAKDCYKRLRDERKGATANKASGKHEFDDPTYAFTAASVSPQRKNTSWFLDSGASQHMTDQRDLFTSFEPVTSYWPVTGIAESLRQVKGVGEIRIRTKIGGLWNDGKLSGVLYVPGLNTNLISVGAAADHGIISTFKKKKAFLTRNNQIIAVGRRTGKDLYLLDIEAISHRQTNLSVSTPLSITTWHQRLGHIHEGAIRKLAQGDYVTGLNIMDADDVVVSPCVGCAKGKSHRQPFPVGGRT